MIGVTITPLIPHNSPNFNPDTKQWNLISLIPIMPSIKYTLELRPSH